MFLACHRLPIPVAQRRAMTRGMTTTLLRAKNASRAMDRNRLTKVIPKNAGKVSCLSNCPRMRLQLPVRFCVFLVVNASAMKRSIQSHGHFGKPPWMVRLLFDDHAKLHDDGSASWRRKRRGQQIYFPFFCFSFLASFCFLSLAFSFFPFVSPIRRLPFGSFRLCADSLQPFL